MSHADQPEAPGADTSSPAGAGPDPTRRRLLGGLAAVGMGLMVGGCDALPGSQAETATPQSLALDRHLRGNIKNIVVIYAENRSFSNLYGNFPGVLRPLAGVPAQHAMQFDRDGKTPLGQLPPIWGGLVPQAQQVDGRRYAIAEQQITGLPNAPFPLADAGGNPLPLGVITRDLWHRFYQNQMQISGGRNNQFVAWANSGALVMGHYRDTAEYLQLWKVAQRYTLCDNFFMAAFGGSWLNHMFLISAQPPFYPDVHNSPARHHVSELDGDDPAGTRLKVAANSPASALDGPPKFTRDGALTPDGYGVNTMAAPYQPSSARPAPGGNPAFADAADSHVLPAQTHATIGDLLSAKGVTWAWYSGAWQYALEHRGGSAVPDFQYHHQPFNYFRNYAPGTEARRVHLRDAGVGEDPATNHFIADIDAGRLPAVTFYKPQGNLNMHAGYADVASGDRHITNVLAHLESGPQWANTLVIVTHDENGGWWDHVSPPPGDRWGPGNRIPALIVSPHARKGFVDHTVCDTNSILRLISRVHGLPKLPGVALRDTTLQARGQAPLGDLTHALDFSGGAA